MYVPRSSASVTNSTDPLAELAQSDAGQPPVADDGVWSRAASGLVLRLRQFRSSLTAKFALLVGIFIALPFLIYGEFDKADEKLRTIVTRGMQHQSWLTARALKPALDAPGHMPKAELSDALAQYTGDGTRLQLMLKPTSAGAAQHFFFVASSPSIQADQVDQELDGLESHGIIDRLSKSCVSDAPIDVQYQRPGGADQIQASLVPIQTRWGCWILISSHTTSEFLDTSVARPLWTTRETKIAAAIYLLAGLVVVLLVIAVSRSLLHFRRVAGEIRQGRMRDASFASLNVAPELSSVAADFDALAHDLHNVARDIRQAAEDNAHSFKAPVAAIEASLETARRKVDPADSTVRRAYELMGHSIDRLKALISASQHLDNITAELIEAPRLRLDLAELVGGVVDRFRDLLTERGIRIVSTKDERIFVNGNRQILEVAIENIIDNAISFSPRDSVIQIALGRSAKFADLSIDDQGPGIDPQKIDRIFDRYFSLRPAHAADECWEGALSHAGLGLWIVRRNIEAMGGRVTATNRLDGGLKVRIVLPLSRR